MPFHPKRKLNQTKRRLNKRRIFLTAALTGSIGLPFSLRLHNSHNSMQEMHAQKPVGRMVLPETNTQKFAPHINPSPIPKQAIPHLPEENKKITRLLAQNYLEKGKKLPSSDPDFQKLQALEQGPHIKWYGRAANDPRLRKACPELALIMNALAGEYYRTFKELLMVGPAWDYQGHSKNSAHYSGLGIDIDVGPDIGTRNYAKWGKQRFQWIAKWIEANTEHVRILFGEKINGNVTVVPEHDNHMHLDLNLKKP